MSLQHAEHALSRVPNGNFANGASHWGSLGSVEVQESHGAGKPSRVLRMARTAWVDIPYRDLAVYPSVVDIPDVQMEPFSFTEYLARGYAKYNTSSIYPFATPTGAVVLTPGDIIYADDFTLGQFSGEYRATRTIDRITAALQAPAGLPVRIAGRDAIVFYSRGPSDLPSMFRVTFDQDVRLLGVVVEDYLAADVPRMSGKITQLSLDGKTAYVFSETAKGHVLPPDTGGAQVTLGLTWIIRPYFRAHLRRRLPVCLYDLTLAFSMQNGSTLSANDIYLDFYSETGALIETIRPLHINPVTLTARFISKAIPGADYTRYVCRFMAERLEPNYGSVRLRFGTMTLSGTTRIGDVVLFRGDYTQQMRMFTGSGQTFDYLEKFVGDDAEVIPRGTVVAYVGGAACPNGWVRVEGVGRDSSDMRSAEALNTILGDFDIMAGCNYGLRDRKTDKTEPRTYMNFSGLALRTDIRAGHTLEFRFAQRSVFALISSAGQEKPVDPSAAQSSTYYEIELVGDYVTVCQLAAIHSTVGELWVWRTGVIAHVQGAPDLRTRWRDAGGYGCLGPDHTHAMKASQDIEQGNVVWTTREVGSGHPIPAIIRNRYDNHNHLPIRTASVVPRVRPVLLCQKI